MYLTQEQIDVLKQNLRKKRIKIEILDYDLKVVDSIEGQAIGGSLTADANNDIRRSGNIEIAIPLNANATALLNQLNGYTIESGGKIWLDKYVKIYVGIDNVFSPTNETIWYNMGVYLINSPTRTISATNFTLSFECTDLMAKLTGSRQGQLTGLGVTIEQGHYDDNKEYQKTTTREALISVITELGCISKYTIYPIPETKAYLPFDIKVGTGSTVYDILKKFLDILSTWQMYFDKDGVFVVEPIPDGENAIIYDLEEQQYLSDSMNCDFENVKNQVVVYGRLNTLTYYTENTDDEPNNVQYSGNSLILTYSSLQTENFTIGGTTFGFYSLDTPNASVINNVKIYAGDTLVLDSDLVKFENSTNSFGVDYLTTQIEIGTFLPNEIYFIRIFSGTQTLNSDNVPVLDLTDPVVFEFMGKQQVAYNLVNTNKNSPFYINNNFPNNTANYYAGLATTPSGANWGEGYELTLNDEDSFATSLVEGNLITFQANALNSYAENSIYTFINVKSSNGTTLVSNVPLVQNKWETVGGISNRPPVLPAKIDNDFTIWLLRYEVVSGSDVFVLVGRNPSALTKVFEGGEYDNIYADQLAYERCLWELFQHSNMNNNITIGTVPNYLIDVNCKIAYNQNGTLPHNIYDTQPFWVNDGEDDYEQFVTALNNDFYVRYDETKYYLTKQVTYPLGVESSEQSITAIEIYPSGNLVGSDYKN